MADEPLDYVSPDTAAADRERRWRRVRQRIARPLLPWLPRWINTGLMPALVVLLVLLLWPVTRKTNPYHGSFGKCLANLRQIGVAMQLYADRNAGAMPPDLATLDASEGPFTRVFACPASDETAAILPADLAMPGHCSFVYLGTGLRKQWTANDVVLYERAANHGESLNALFGDGHVESIDGPLVAQLLARGATATQPVRLPAGRSPHLRSPR